MCYDRIFWVCRPPMQHPNGYKSHLDFFPWKRLTAPKPYFDEDGFYHAPWMWLCVRRVYPSTMAIPEPIKPLPLHGHIAALKLIIEARTLTLV